MAPPPPTPPPPPPPHRGASDRAAKMQAQVEALFASGRVADAVALALRWAAQEPASPAAQQFASFAQHHAGREESALHYAQRWAELAPQNPRAHQHVSRMLMSLGRLMDALRPLESALALAPHDPSLSHELCLLLSVRREYARGVEVATTALARDPSSRAVRTLLVSLLVSAGRVEDALAEAKRLISTDAQDANARSLACLAGNYLELTGEESRAMHEDFGACVAKLPKPVIAAPQRAARADDRGPRTRPLRVGFLSPDLREHSVTAFLEPIFDHAGALGVQIFAYHTNKLEDDVSARLRARATKWWHQNAPPPDEVARVIAADCLDVLVDLAGHTQPFNLYAMSLRPAPVQVTYLGYPSSTGLHEMDFRIVDSVTDPVGSEHACSEKLLRLDPCFLCFRPPAGAPMVAPLAEGPPAFVSFNALQKITPHTCALWAGVLKTVPGATLTLKMTNLSEAALRDEVRSQLAAWGLPMDRVSILCAMSSRAEHLALYNSMWVGLDTFPYHGTTTTCEALWMGVPVVTRVGGCHASRVGASLLRTIGLAELAAETDEGFIATAAALAQDVARLRAVRESLRDRVAASPLCDGRAFAERFFAGLEQISRERR